jgi:hypothetical protein
MTATIELTERDTRIFRALHTHRVLTTPQIGELFFNGTYSRAAQRRLLKLAERDTVDRFVPRQGHWNAPYHWTLALEGARILAGRQGLTPQQIGYRPDAQRRMRISSQLPHTTGLAQSYVAFATNARATQGVSLQRWWSQALCRVNWGRHVRPDAYLRWRQNDTDVDAFIEYDTGTEPLARVAAKISRYRDLAEETQLRSPVLFIVTGPKRLTNLCRVLDVGGGWVPVHVTTLDQLTYPGPARPIWRRAGDPACTLRSMIELT